LNKGVHHIMLEQAGNRLYGRLFEHVHDVMSAFYGTPGAGAPGLGDGKQ